METSPNNFQLWLNHGRVLSQQMSTLAARELARRFGGDLSSADWRHFGTLAGFINQREKRRLPNGLPPFVKLREASGRTYRAAEQFLREVTTTSEQTKATHDNRKGPTTMNWGCQDTRNSPRRFSLRRGPSSGRSGLGHLRRESRLIRSRNQERDFL